MLDCSQQPTYVDVQACVAWSANLVPGINNAMNMKSMLRGGSGEPLVLIHGFGSYRGVWAPVRALLEAEGFDVLGEAADVPVQIAHAAGWGGYGPETDAALAVFADAAAFALYGYLGFLLETCVDADSDPTKPVDFRAQIRPIIDARCSNMGHLLWSGIALPERAAACRAPSRRGRAGTAASRGCPVAGR